MIKKKVEINEPMKDGNIDGDRGENKSQHNQSDKEMSHSPLDYLDDSDLEYFYSGYGSVMAELKNIREIIDNKIRHDKAKETAFNYLYDELDSLKNNRSFEEIRSIFVDLIHLNDRIEYFLSNKEITVEALNSIQEEVVEILIRRDISRIERDSREFDPSFQRVLGYQSVNKREDDGRVVDVVREGFVYGATIIRPQEVILGRYKKSSEQEEV